MAEGQRWSYFNLCTYLKTSVVVALTPDAVLVPPIEDVSAEQKLRPPRHR